MDAERRQEIPGSETKDYITHRNSGRSISIVSTNPLRINSHCMLCRRGGDTYTLNDLHYRRGTTPESTQIFYTKQ